MKLKRVFGISIMVVIAFMLSFPVNAFDTTEDFLTFAITDVPNKGSETSYWVDYDDWDSNLFGDGSLWWQKSGYNLGVFEIYFNWKMHYTVTTSGGNWIGRFMEIRDTDANRIIRFDWGKWDMASTTITLQLYVENNVGAGTTETGIHDNYVRNRWYWSKIVVDASDNVLTFTYNTYSDMIYDNNCLERLNITGKTLPANYERLRVNRPLPVAQTYRRYGDMRHLVVNDFSADPLDPDIYNFTIIDDFHINNSYYNPSNEYLFVGEVYNLTCYFKLVDYALINFTDGEHEIQFVYINDTYPRVYTDTNGTFKIGDIRIQVISFDEQNNETRVTWIFILDRNIIDSEPIWTYYLENDIGGVLHTKRGNFWQCRIYNLGGYTYYTFTGDGGRAKGSHPFGVNATDGATSSTARAEQIFRKLQHIHFLMEIEMSNEWDAVNGEFDIDVGVGYVDVGIDYRLDGQWITGWYVKLYVYQADVGHHIGGNDHNWIEWAVDWYNYDPKTSTHQNIKSDYIFSNHWGYENENLTPDHHKRNSSQLWVDLWFDRSNASTTVGGQVNSYYYGMREHGSAWWFGYGVFQPVIGEEVNSIFIDDLYDEKGEVSNSLKFDLMRVWVRVGKINDADGNDETWSIRNIEDIFRQLASDRMEGVDQPTFVETKVLDMPQTGFIASIVKAINGISTMIWKGAYSFLKLIWVAIDSFATFIGLPTGFMSRMMEFVMLIPDLIIALVEYVSYVALYAVTLLDQIFSLVILVIPQFFWIIAEITFTFVSFWMQLFSLFTGGWTGVSNIWVEFSLGEWIQLVLYCIFPVWQVNRIFMSDDPMKQAKEDAQTYIWLFNGVYTFFINTLTLTRTLIGVIIDILPI